MWGAEHDIGDDMSRSKVSEGIWMKEVAMANSSFFSIEGMEPLFFIIIT